MKTLGRSPRALAAAAAVVLGTSVAAAEPTAQQKAAAQALFDEARALTEADTWAPACPKYEESLRLDRTVGTLYYLAQCLEHVGKLAGAWTYYVEAADAAGAAGRASQAAHASKAAAALKPRVPRLAVKVAPAARLPGLAVKRDDEAVGEAQWGVAIPIEVGAHRVTAGAPGKQAWSRELDVQEGQLVEIEVPALSDPPAPPPPQPRRVVTAPPPPPPPPPGPSKQRLAGFVVGGVGLGGLVASFGLGAAALSKKADSNAPGNCDPVTNVCSDAGLALRSQGLGLATGSTVAFVGGLAALGTGVALLVTSAPGRARTPTVAVGPSGVALEWRW